MSEPREPKKLIKPENWEEFLKEFSGRNKNRRARFDVFRSSGKTEEEAQELRLEEVVLRRNGERENVEITRVDHTETEVERSKETVTNVRGIAVQYDVDGSEDALEITDDQNTLIMLRMESKVDGAS
ncbi:MAG: hypothetical protein ABI686_03840 [Acidobacteriota bacterium]